MPSTDQAPGRSRRSYSRALKAQVVAECADPNNSIAGVALAHGINANIVHKWVRLHERSEVGDVAQSGFVALPFCPPSKSSPSNVIKIEVSRAGTSINVHWPTNDSVSCAAWLSEWLR